MNQCNDLKVITCPYLQGVFAGIIGADSMGDVCKPEEAAFQRALEISGASPKTTAMFEDSFKNLRTAKKLGMTTILVAGETAAEENVTRQAPHHLEVWLKMNGMISDTFIISSLGLRGLQLLYAIDLRGSCSMKLLCILQLRPCIDDL